MENTTVVESIYRVLENNPGEWVIAKAADPYFLWSAQGWVRDEDGVYIMNFPSEVEALTFAQQQPSLHLPSDDVTAPWRDWPTEHLLRKIEMPEEFIAELRKRLKEQELLTPSKNSPNLNFLTTQGTPEGAK